MEAVDKWAKLEEIIRRVVREELQALGKTKTKIEFVNGKFVGVSEFQTQAWMAAYPGVDIEAEIKRAAAWCVSNPMTAPASQFGRYLNSWLSREQNKSAMRQMPLRSEEKVQPKKACAYCSKDAIGSTSGIYSCRDHTQDAMEGKPRRMLGVVPKAVAGPD
jgi:hypothetical protein